MQLAIRRLQAAVTRGLAPPHAWQTSIRHDVLLHRGQRISGDQALLQVAREQLATELSDGRVGGRETVGPDAGGRATGGVTPLFSTLNPDTRHPLQPYPTTPEPGTR